MINYHYNTEFSDKYQPLFPKFLHEFSILGVEGIKYFMEVNMEFIKSLLSFLLKLILVLVVVGTAGVAILAFFLKKDVDEIKEFTEKLKHELEAENK